MRRVGPDPRLSAPPRRVGQSLDDAVNYREAMKGVPRTHHSWQKAVEMASMSQANYANVHRHALLNGRSSARGRIG